MTHEGDGTRLPLLEPEALDPVRRALHAQIVGGPRAADSSRSPVADGDGRLMGAFNAMLVNPEVGGPLQALGAAIRYRTGLGDARREIAILTVATALESDFEWFSHEQLGRAAGLSDATLTTISHGGEPIGWEAGDAIVYRSTRALLSSGDLDDEEFGALEAEIGTTGCVELVVLVGYYRTLALILQTFRVPLPADAAQ